MIVLSTRPTERADMRTKPRILFVCLGNICRSPTAEAVLRELAPQLEIDSAGVGDWHIGNPPYRPAIDAAAARGYDLEPLRARQISPRDYGNFDLILAMDSQNFVALGHMAPKNSRAEVRLFLDFALQDKRRDVPDPYYTRDFEGALDLIEMACKGLLKSL